MLKMNTPLATVLLLGTAGLNLHAHAAVPDTQAARLGGDLTPLGAEKAGEGDVPAWSGGITGLPADTSFDPMRRPPDPFADDKPLFTIDKSNMSGHADRLTDASKALLEAYPSYKLNIYQSRRSCAYPENVYEAAKRNAKVGGLTEGGNGVAGAIMGTPFPIPNNALEIVWNHSLRYRAFKVARQFAVAPVTRGGEYSLIRAEDQIIFNYSDPSKKRAEELDNTSIFYIVHTVAPARSAGNITLVHEAINAAKQPRQAWQYSPGTRRVRRAPNIAYDNPGTNSDGLSTADAFDGFNGAPDRYDWTVKGKSVKYIPYNAFKSEEVAYEEFLQPLHANPDAIRYEPHRVWTIEANLRPDTRHVYGRRVIHLDEDSWQIAQTELYDTRGVLWRAQELMGIPRYQVPLCWSGAELVYDLQAGRYLAVTMQNEEVPYNYQADELHPDLFTPAYIRQLGTR